MLHELTVLMLIIVSVDFCFAYSCYLLLLLLSQDNAAACRKEPVGSSDQTDADEVFQTMIEHEDECSTETLL